MDAGRHVCRRGTTPLVAAQRLDGKEVLCGNSAHTSHAPSGASSPGTGLRNLHQGSGLEGTGQPMWLEGAWAPWRKYLCRLCRVLVGNSACIPTEWWARQEGFWWSLCVLCPCPFAPLPSRILSPGGNVCLCDKIYLAAWSCSRIKNTVTVHANRPTNMKTPRVHSKRCRTESKVREAYFFWPTGLALGLRSKKEKKGGTNDSCIVKRASYIEFSLISSVQNKRR